MSQIQENPISKAPEGGEEGGGQEQKKIRLDEKKPPVRGEGGGGQTQKEIRSDSAAGSDR